MAYILISLHTITRSDPTQTHAPAVVRLLCQQCGGGGRKKEAGKDRDLPSGQNVSCHPFQRKRKSVRSVNGGVERMKEEEEEEEKVWKRQKDGGGRGEMELRREGGKGGREVLSPATSLT